MPRLRRLLIEHSLASSLADLAAEYARQAALIHAKGHSLNLEAVLLHLFKRFFWPVSFTYPVVTLLLEGAIVKRQELKLSSATSTCKPVSKGFILADPLHPHQGGKQESIQSVLAMSLNLRPQCLQPALKLFL